MAEGQRKREGKCVHVHLLAGAGSERLAVFRLH